MYLIYYLFYLTVNTKCNNCKPLPEPIRHPICTIRSKPTLPMHCVTYAISLYNLLFGPEDKENYLADLIYNTDVDITLIFDTLFAQQEQPRKCTYQQAIQDQTTIADHTLAHYVNQFVTIYTNLIPHKGELKFDKDDSLSVKFVTAVTNLRTYNFINENSKLHYMDQQ